jgi:hypothetical protein
MASVVRPSASAQVALTSEATLDFIANQIHPDWVRWCYTSINKHFDGSKRAYSLYLEGDARTLQSEAEFAELRMDGPFIEIPQKRLYYLDVEINILCQTHVDPRQHYSAQVMVGTFASAFRNQIPVYKFGDGPLDDGSLLGCFHLQRSLKEKVDISYFGVIKSDTKILQTTIEGHYRLELWREGE